MRIAVINLTGGGISGGYRKYLSNVLPRMAAHPDVEALLCVSPKTLNIPSWLGPIANVEFADCRALGLIAYKIYPELKLRLERFLPDVIFMPVERYFHFNNVPVVNMVRNMEPFAGTDEDNPLSERVKTRVRSYSAKRAIKKADRVIAISKFVKWFLMKRWDIPEDRIGLVYHGIDASGRHEAVRPSMVPAGWEGKFIFTAGSIRPARGIEDILEAIHFLSDKQKASAKLVIAGEAGANMQAYQEKMKGWLKQRGLSDRVCWTGNLSDDEMRWCYNNCRIFIMSSRVESFGQIALEAIAQGCICISANNPCLPEIFKEAAIYYPPRDSQSLAKAIESVFNWDSGQKERMVEMARDRANEFSWDGCVNKTIEELIRAYERR